MLKRAGEENGAAGDRSLELVPERPEADHHGSGTHVPDRVEKQIRALLARELPDVDDGRIVAGEEVGEPLRVSRIGIALAGTPGVRGVLPRLLDEACKRLVAELRSQLVDVDARRRDPDAGLVGAGPEDLLEDTADVLRPRVDGVSTVERLAGTGGELLVSPQRELELRAVSLDGERHAARQADRASREDVIHEQEVGRELGPNGRGVRLDVLVVVEDEDRQRPGKPRADDARAAEVEPLAVGLLAEDDDLMAGPRPFARERARVDVRAGAAQEVAVPEENLHGWWILTNCSSAGRSAATSTRSTRSSSATVRGSSRSPRERSARRTRRRTRCRRRSSAPGARSRASVTARASRPGSTGSQSTARTTSGNAAEPSPWSSPRSVPILATRLRPPSSRARCRPRSTASTSPTARRSSSTTSSAARTSRSQASSAFPRGP